MAETGGHIDAFLAWAGWGAAIRQPLAGDASARRYWRLNQPGKAATAVLMVADADAADSLRSFVRIADCLRDIGLSAPAVIAEDCGNGLLLLEDFGDQIFAHVLAADPGREPDLYRAAVAVLEHLHHAVPPQGMALFGPESMAQQAALVYPCYKGGTEGRDAFQYELERELRHIVTGQATLLLRDYHAENLVWLPERYGLRIVGLLDFQDAMIGPPGYDLVSLLYDVRRDVPADLAERLVGDFASRTGNEREAFAVQCALLSAQRNLRILGVFGRLSREQGKTGYIDLVPRVWDQLARALSHPALSALAARVRADLPPPDAEHLKRLREPCVPSCQ